MGRCRIGPVVRSMERSKGGDAVRSSASGDMSAMERAGGPIPRKTNNDQAANFSSSVDVSNALAGMPFAHGSSTG